MKFRFFLFLLIPIPQFLLAQEALESFSRAALNIKGNVTKVTEAHYGYDEEGEWMKEPFKKITYYFNDKGQLTKKVARFETDLLYDEETVTYSYDKEGRLASIIDGSEKEYFKYSMQGKFVTRSTTGTYTEKDIFELDQKGRVKEWTNYTGKEARQYKKLILSYSSAGRLMESRHYGGFEDGSSFLFGYNGHGDIAGINKFDSKTRLINKKTFKYDHDRHSNWIRCSLTETDSDGEIYEYSLVRTYEYGSGKAKAGEADVFTSYTGFDPIPQDEAYYDKAQDYYYGRGVVQSYNEAARWYESAARIGHVQSMKDLAYLYSTNKIGKPDPESSYRWYREAADKGDGYAMMKVGNCYELGSGVPKDLAEAMRWYKQAVKAGEIGAKLHIGLLYKDGKGVPVNKTEARKWLGELAAAGSQDAKKVLEEMDK